MSVHKTDREQLIEEAAKAMHREVYSGAPSWPDTGKRIREQWLNVARAALAVFEQAHTPIGDERELRTLRDVAKTYDANFPCDGGCNVNDGPEETCSRHGRSPRDLWNLLDAARRTVQGEPTDAPSYEELRAEVARLEELAESRWERVLDATAVARRAVEESEWAEDYTQYGYVVPGSHGREAFFVEPRGERYATHQRRIALGRAEPRAAAAVREEGQGHGE